ncbi:DinB [Candidatus Sulfopaludibacter sp. SbA3]|nr:DinB [Candidatus Sulfopaludibacter sp. SbA3]
MLIRDALLPEFDQEAVTTRKVLERCPEEKFGWQPHAKSWTMGQLATHIVNLPTWVMETLNKDELDYAPPGAEPPKAELLASSKELLERYDENIAAARAALAGASNEQFMGNWTLLAGGTPLFTMPRVAVIRSFVFNHGVHHRAQLGVYLRLNDIPVPQTYGPTADEP